MKLSVVLTVCLLLTGCSTITFPTMVFLHPVTGATGDCPGRTITYGVHPSGPQGRNDSAGSLRSDVARRGVY